MDNRIVEYSKQTASIAILHDSTCDEYWIGRYDSMLHYQEGEPMYYFIATGGKTLAEAQVALCNLDPNMF